MKKKSDKKPDNIEQEKSKSSVADQIKELEERISNTKYNKKTQHAIGMYKAKLAQLKQKQEARRSVGKAQGEGYNVKKTGDGTVIMLGFPSVGKSTLLNALTNANSPVAHYAFTTLTVIPGLLVHKFAKIQILDMPGIDEGAASGRGRGKEVLAVIRNADLIMILVDVLQYRQYDKILKEVYDVHVRLDQKKPDVKITKTAKGGVKVGSTVKLTHLTVDMIKDMCHEFKLTNADIVLREDITTDQFIDVIEGNKAYTPSLVVVNKIDMATPEVLEKVRKDVNPGIMISAQNKVGINELKDKIFDKMNFMRLYLKEVNKKADMEEPMIMFKGCTIKDVCMKLHRDFIDKFKYARLWGPSAKHDAMVVRKTEHVLQEGDILELHIK